MKKLILLLLFIPLVTFGQNENVKKNEKTNSTITVYSTCVFLFK